MANNDMANEVMEAVVDDMMDKMTKETPIREMKAKIAAKKIAKPRQPKLKEVAPVAPVRKYVLWRANDPVEEK